MVITNLKIDKKLSMESFHQFEDYIIRKGCYFNVARIYLAFKKIYNCPTNFQIAYGYYGNPKVKMCRHCFFVYNGNVILDPAYLYDDENQIENTNYHIFKTMNFVEYQNMLDEFYKSHTDDTPPSLMGMIPEEAEYCRYAITNQIYIYEEDYNDDLKKYDIEGKVLTMNDEEETKIYAFIDKIRNGEIKNEFDSSKSDKELAIEYFQKKTYNN